MSTSKSSRSVPPNTGRSAAHTASRATTVRSKAAPKPKANNARVFSTVDTNVAAHDRTDPFAALATLRRLLSLLPSRLGGCQYKLAPEEHRLAVHLLGIVEPFVQAQAPGCACVPRRTLLRLPTEILDAIVFWVDDRRDLSALAETCRRMHDVVVPRHVEYRVVKCKVSSVRVWHHFVVHRALARNVRRLEVLDERTGEAEVVPAGIIATETDLESTDDELGMHAKQERFMLAALAKMTALRAVKWSCNHSLVAFERVWPALVKCGSIQEVEVNDNVVFQAVSPEDVPADGAIQKQRPAVLPNLRKAGFHGTKSTFGASKNPDLAHVSSMLNICPNLDTLSISYVPRRGPGFFNPVADDFLLCGRWSRLRSLTLTSLWCTPNAGLDAMSAFLLAHANLEVLHLDIAFGTGGHTGNSGALTAFKFPPNCLPRLKELKASRDFATALIGSPVDSAEGRPLEVLKGVRLSGSPRDRVFLENLKLHAGQTVHRLELAGWNEMEDVRKLAECLPKLTWLDLGKKEGAAVGNPSGSSKQLASISSNSTEWATALANFTELTTFHGVRFFYEVASQDGAALTLSDQSRVRKNDEVASVLAWKCPKLRRLDHWEDGSGKVIVLVRDAERVRYQVRRTKA